MLWGGWKLYILVQCQQYNVVGFNIEYKYIYSGLDVAKHGEPAYPFRSYGDGWHREDSFAEPEGAMYSRK